jgi:hypothetical protein
VWAAGFKAGHVPNPWPGIQPRQHCSVPGARRTFRPASGARLVCEPPPGPDTDGMRSSRVKSCPIRPFAHDAAYGVPPRSPSRRVKQAPHRPRDLPFARMPRQCAAKSNTPHLRHPREGGDPGRTSAAPLWIPAFAGMTKGVRPGSARKFSPAATPSSSPAARLPARPATYRPPATSAAGALAPDRAVRRDT